MSNKRKHILLVCNNYQGHNIPALKLYWKIFKGMGYKVTLLADCHSQKAKEIIQHSFPEFFNEPFLPIRDENEKHIQGSFPKAIEWGYERTQPDEVFVSSLHNCFSVRDYIKNGLRPFPEILKGKISGVIIELSFFQCSNYLEHLIKYYLFSHYFKSGYLRAVFCESEHFINLLRKKGINNLFFIPATPPAHPIEKFDKQEARRKLNLPDEGSFILMYGRFTPHKGLSFLKKTFQKYKNSNLKLIIAGKHVISSSKDLQEWKKLTDQKRAFIFNRFVNEKEQDLLFSAADWVILPYTNKNKDEIVSNKFIRFLKLIKEKKNFDSSGVFTLATLYNRPIIYSDSLVVANDKIQNYDLGFSFPSEDSNELLKIFDKISPMTQEDLDRFIPDLQSFGNTQSFEQVKTILREHF